LLRNSEKQYQAVHRFVKKKSIVLPSGSALIWAGSINFLGAALYSGRHKGMPLGCFKRFLVLAFSVWLIVIGLGLAA
jgi:hypothetical protein